VSITTMEPLPVLIQTIKLFAGQVKDPITKQLFQMYQNYVNGWLQQIQTAYWNLNRATWNLAFNNAMVNGGLDCSCAVLYAQMNNGQYPAPEFVNGPCGDGGPGGNPPVPVVKESMLIPVSSIGFVNTNTKVPRVASNPILPEISSPFSNKP
jgi:hypothetical protein